MKTLLFVILATLILFAGIGLYIYELNCMTKMFFISIDSIQTDIKSNNWEMCENQVNKLEAEWKEKKKLLSAFTDHGDLDNAEETMCELKTSIFHRNVEESLKSAEKLRVYFWRIQENESPTWENILKYSLVGGVVHNM